MNGRQKRKKIREELDEILVDKLRNADITKVGKDECLLVTIDPSFMSTLLYNRIRVLLKRNNIKKFIVMPDNNNTVRTHTLTEEQYQEMKAILEKAVNKHAGN